MDLSAIKSKLASLQQQQQPSNTPRKQVLWRPSVGKQIVRVVPSKFNKSNPFTEMYFHYGIGERTMASPTNWGQKDPIVEFAKQLRSTGDRENYRLARQLDPKMRVYLPIIVRGEEHEGVKLWGFGKEIYMELLSMAEDEDIGDYTDILTGRDLTLTTIGADATGTGYNKTTIRARTATTPLSEDKALLESLLNDQVNPKEYFTPLGFDEMKSVLQKWLAPEEQEGAISSEPATPFDSDNTSTNEVPWTAPAEESKSENKFSIEAQGKKPVSSADKFDSLFSDDDLPF